MAYKFISILLLTISLSFKALGCDLIDGDFELNGELVSERMSSNEEYNEKSSFLSLATMLNTNYPKLVGDPKTVAIHIEITPDQHYLKMTHLLETGEFGRQFKRPIICEGGNWLIQEKVTSANEGAYQTSESRRWVSLTNNEELLVHIITQYSVGIFFKDNYYHERVAKFHKLK